MKLGKLLQTEMGPTVDRFSLKLIVWIAVAGVALTVVGRQHARAESPDHRDRRGDWPVYQRHAFDWMDKRERGDRFQNDRFRHAFAPPVSSGWFQRPYPYHLDYYRMRYGGSYAPYFGNLYGPPQVVTAPPYYGPYYGGYESGYPPSYGPNGMLDEPPQEEGAPKDQAAAPPNGDSLPPPAP
jgi:hypothetical protein